MIGIGEEALVSRQRIYQKYCGKKCEQPFALIYFDTFFSLTVSSNVGKVNSEESI